MQMSYWNDNFIQKFIHSKQLFDSQIFKLSNIKLIAFQFQSSFQTFWQFPQTIMQMSYWNDSVIFNRIEMNSIALWNSDFGLLEMKVK